MTRKFKAFGLALVAVFAMSAIAASGAQAVGHSFDTPGHTTSVVTANSEGVQTLATGNFEVKCQKASFVGTVAGELENKTVTAVPTYSECKLGEEAATVRTNHCAYVLGGDTSTAGDAPAEIECAAGSAIEVETELCTLKFGAQKPQNGVHFIDTTNATTGKEEVTIQATATHVKYSGEGFFCVFAGNGEDGSYTGNTTAGAFEDTKLVSGTELTTPSSYTHGSQINLKLTTNST